MTSTALNSPPHSKGIKKAVAVGVLFMLESVVAQPTPGDISRQVEPVRVPELPALKLEPHRMTLPSQPEPGAQVVRVQRWVFEGNQALSSEVLQALLQPFSAVDVSLTQIREAAAVVQQAYDDAGWLARVDVPPQDITSGLLRLQITEARLGQIQLDASATTLVDPERVKAFVQAQQPVGQPLHVPSLDRGLLLADDLSGVSVAGTLKASAQRGATDVLLKAAAEPAYGIEVSVDNGNARSVGANKLSISGTWVSPAGYGESYSAQAFKSEGAEYLRASASAPLGYSGLRGSVNLSQLDYKVVTPDAAGLAQNISGRSQSLGVDLIYPLLRSRPANLYLTAGLDERRYRGQANGEQNSHYRIEGGQVGLAGNFFDGLGGGAANSYSLTWRHGQVKSGQVAVNEEVVGRFQKLNWSLSRQQAVNSAVSVFAAINGQSTGSKALDGSENFSLGGPSGVRAYPVGEASGPQGHVVNLEVRYRINSQWLVTPFYDRGRIEKRTADNLRSYSLEGAGVSVSWTGPAGWTAKGTYARRMGDNPNADITTGKDQDGSLSKDRVWLTVSRSF